MSVKAYALTTGQRAADFIGLGTLSGADLTLMERRVDSVTEYIENYIGFRVKKTAYTSEEYDTDRGDSFLLKNYPIDSAETFTLQRRNTGLSSDDWQTVESQYYHVDYESGIVTAAYGLKFGPTRRGYRVDYTAGYDFDNAATFLSDTEGGDLELCAWMLLSSIYVKGVGGIGVSSESIGDYRIVYSKSMMESEDIKSILDKYAKQDTFGVITPVQI